MRFVFQFIIENFVIQKGLHENDDNTLAAAVTKSERVGRVRKDNGKCTNVEHC